MSAVERGGSYTGDVLVRGSYGGSYVDPDTGTLSLTIRTPSGGVALTVAEASLTRLGIGHYAYTWGVAADATLGDWTWQWDALVDGVDLPDATEVVTVVAAGSLANRLTVDDLREHVTTDLADSALQRLIDDAYATVEAITPLSGSVTERLPGGYANLVLSYPALAIESITEDLDHGDTALAADDYRLASPYVVRRLHHGTNSRYHWWGESEITYTVDVDLAIVEGVVIDLVKLASDYSPGVSSERLGDYSRTAAARPYDEERMAILARLGRPASLAIVGR